MGNSHLNKTTAQARNVKTIAGVAKHFSKVKTLTIGGVDYTAKELAAVFQAENDDNMSLDRSRAQFTKQAAATRATRAKASKVRQELRSYILGFYGAGAVDVLEDFGMKPPKTKGPKTVTAKAQAQAKAGETRAAHRVGNKPTAAAPTQPASTVTPQHS